MNLQFLMICLSSFILHRTREGCWCFSSHLLLVLPQSKVTLMPQAISQSISQDLDWCQRRRIRVSDLAFCHWLQVLTMFGLGLMPWYMKTSLVFFKSGLDSQAGPCWLIQSGKPFITPSRPCIWNLDMLNKYNLVHGFCFDAVVFPTLCCFHPVKYVLVYYKSIYYYDYFFLSL